MITRSGEPLVTLVPVQRRKRPNPGFAAGSGVVMGDDFDELPEWFMLSTVAPWEMSIRWASGKLQLPEHPRLWSRRIVGELTLDVFPIGLAHVGQVADLPAHHRDPSDRLLIAQAQVESIPIVTTDPVFTRYDVEVIIAR